MASRDNYIGGYYDIRIQVTYYPESLLQWGAYVIPSTTDKGMIMSQKNKNDPDQTTAITGSNGWVGKNLQQGEYLNTVLAPLLIED
jgi:hypothetical protein